MKSKLSDSVNKQQPSLEEITKAIPPGVQEEEKAQPIEKHLTVQGQAAPPSTQTAPPPPPEWDYSEYADTAPNQEFTSDDVTMPFLILLQAQSPWCQEGDKKYIAGAKQGDTLLTAGDILYPKGTPLQIISVDHFRAVIEFEVDEKFKIIRTVDVHQAVKESKRELFSKAEAKQFGGKTHHVIGQTKDGNFLELIDTAYHYVLVLGDQFPNGAAPAIMKFVRSKFGAFKELNDGIKANRSKKLDGRWITIPDIAQVFNVSSQPVQRDLPDGSKSTFAVWTFQFDRALSPAKYEEKMILDTAVQFVREIRAGTTKPIDHAADAIDPEDEGETEYAPGARDGDDDSGDGASAAATPF